MEGLVAGESGVVWAGWYGGSALAVKFLFFLSSLFFPHFPHFPLFFFTFFFPFHPLSLIPISTMLLLF
ncbi:hypothetical protein BZA77DRAFT_310560 [Pyronema omphalodes]|nr:hypothetical protein BZA77DRAFT_310560 [Pyronema omphalodes]